MPPDPPIERAAHSHLCRRTLGPTSDARCDFVAHFALHGRSFFPSSLRCQNGIAAEGDSRLALVYKCGQPALRDNYCDPLYYNGSVNTVPEPFAGLYVPCIDAEEWLYERGPGQFPAVVRIRAGKVQSITYGRQPQ
jgi:hypothetical protein